MPRTLKQVAIDMANAFTRWQLWQGGGSSTLSDLTDVEFTDLQADDVLQYDGNKWINTIMQGGGSVGAKVDLLGTLYVGTNQPLSTITQYDLIIFLVRDNSEPWKYRGSATFTKNEIKINNQLVIPSDESERTIFTISDWSIIGRYNLVVYGIKFAPIPESGSYSRELIYNGYTTNSTITLDKNYNDYDEIKIVFEWQGNSFIPEYTCYDYSLNYVMVFYGNSYAYFNFENNNVIRFNLRSSYDICFYKVYGIKYS